MITDEMIWHDDGHAIILQINKSELRILQTICPNRDKEESKCSHPDTPCVVEWFVSRFGLDCNVGVCEPKARMEISWSFVGDKHREIEAGQVWIIPNDDEAFAAWLITQKQDDEPSDN